MSVRSAHSTCNGPVLSRQFAPWHAGTWALAVKTADQGRSSFQISAQQVIPRGLSACEAVVLKRTQPSGQVRLWSLRVT
jgi:hypothetical protein